MISPLKAVRDQLIATPGVTSLVGTRIYPSKAPQGVERPFIVLTTVSSAPGNSMDGVPAERLRIARLQVDVYSPSYEEAHEVADVADAVIADLKSFDLSAAQEAQADLYDDETELRRVSTDYFVAL